MSGWRATLTLLSRSHCEPSGPWEEHCPDLRRDVTFWKWLPLDSVLKPMDTGRERASPDKDSLLGQTAFMPLSLLGPGGHLHVSSLAKNLLSQFGHSPHCSCLTRFLLSPSLPLPRDVWPLACLQQKLWTVNLARMTLLWCLLSVIFHSPMLPLAP